MVATIIFSSALFQVPFVERCALVSANLGAPCQKYLKNHMTGTWHDGAILRFSGQCRSVFVERETMKSFLCVNSRGREEAFSRSLNG